MRTGQERHLFARLASTSSAVAVVVLMTSFVSPAPLATDAPAGVPAVALPPGPTPSAPARPAPVAPETRAAEDRALTARTSARLDALLGARADDVSAVGLDLRTGRQVAYGRTADMMTASVAKLDILLAFLLQAQAAGRPPTATEAALARAMIQRSDNEAASRLWFQVGGGPGVAAANRRLGLEATVPGPEGFWGSTTSSAADQVRLLSAVLDPAGPLTATYRRYAVTLLEGVTPEQRWGVGSLAGSGPVAMKNGRLPRPKDGGRWVVTSVGRIVADGRPLVLAVLTRSSPTMQAGVALIEQVATELRDALATGNTGRAAQPS